MTVQEVVRHLALGFVAVALAICTLTPLVGVVDGGVDPKIGVIKNKQIAEVDADLRVGTYLLKIRIKAVFYQDGPGASQFTCGVIIKGKDLSGITVDGFA